MALLQCVPNNFYPENRLIINTANILSIRVSSNNVNRSVSINDSIVLYSNNEYTVDNIVKELTNTIIDVDYIPKCYFDRLQSLRLSTKNI